MKRKILLINPWIYDFAAYNLWARPLGLFRVAEYLSSFDTELSFIDCPDSFSTGRYGIGRFRREKVQKPSVVKSIPRFYKRYGISLDEFVERVKESLPLDLVLMTSSMSYWYPGVQKVIEIIRSICGGLPIILGGIYATLYHEHAAGHSGTDFIYRGSLNGNLDSALDTFGLKLIKRREPIPYYKLNLYGRHSFAPLLTSIGCPFQCSYCATRFLSDTFQKKPPKVVLYEINELYQLNVRDYVFYDDALLVDADNHIKPLLRSIVETGLDIRFHTPNGIHARFIDEELAGLMKASHFKTIRLSLETVDRERQKDTGGKVTSEDLERAVRHLKKEGFTKKEIGVYLMYGLPGQNIEEVKEGIRFLKGLGVCIYLTEFSPIKGTRSWHELVQKGIIYDDLDPLITNNTVFSYLYSDYDPNEIGRMKLDVKGYNAV